MARPNKYETHVAPRLEEVKDWVRNGATDEEVAQKLGISYSTLKQYKKEFSAFSATLKESKEIVDGKAESALLKRALGYEYDEITQERAENGQLIVTKVVHKHVVPDVTAQIFWLKNRRPNKWREKPVEDTSEEDKSMSVELVIKDLSGNDKDI